MNVLSDTKRLKARLSSFQARQLFDKVIKPYKQEQDEHYHFSVRDRRYGVFLGHLPRAPYMNYTTSLVFHCYSDDSPLLRAIFDVVPLSQWLVSEIHIAFDYPLPYWQFHAVRPAKRADASVHESSIYLGGKSSATRLVIYDKQAQMSNVRGITTDTWTRVELRCSFSPMKRVSSLHITDFASAADYSVLADIRSVPEDIRQIMIGLNTDTVKWKDIDWRTKAKIREYAADKAENLYQHILSNIGDIGEFLYNPSTDAKALTS